MKKMTTYKKIRLVLYIIVFFSSIFIIKYTLDNDIGIVSAESLKKLYISGEYSLNGKDFKPMPEDNDIVLRGKSLIIRGKLSQDIGEKEKFMFRTNNFSCRILVNGNEIYKSLENKSGAIVRTTGGKWVTIDTSGITKDDNIEIQLENIYMNSFSQNYSYFYKNMYGGSEREMFRHLFLHRLVPFVLSMIVIFLGLLLLFMVNYFKLNKTRYNSNVDFMAVFIFTCGLWFVLECEPIVFITRRTSLLISLNMICQFFIMLFGLRYAVYACSGLRRKILSVCEVSGLIYVMTVIFLQLFSHSDFYDLLLHGVIFNLVYIYVAIGCFIYEAFHERKAEKKYILCAAIPLLLGGTAEMLNYMIGYCHESGLFAFSVSVFTMVEILHFLKEYKNTREVAARAHKMEMELMESKVAIMLSQIQPHFLYNSLSAIKALCDEDPQKASKAIERFSFFLRGNLDSLKSAAPIPFKKELDHVNNYLYLEKMRFEERLNIEYDIKCDNFMIPTLTLQPLVENAVRYGVTKNEDGGTVKISTWDTENKVHIKVEDNGPGFVPGEKVSDGRTHIGLENVQKRISEKANGFVNIESDLGKGTRVTITLPKKS